MEIEVRDEAILIAAVRNEVQAGVPLEKERQACLCIGAGRTLTINGGQFMD